MEDIEIWKPIESDADYEISSHGRIKSFKQNKENLLIPRVGSIGYFYVALLPNKVRRNLFIHRLVAYAFLGHKPSGYKAVINHKDGNKLNNHKDNLEVITQRENSHHYWANKRQNRLIGAHYHKRDKKWLSEITVDKKRVHLGSFSTELLAHQAYMTKLNEILQK